MKTIEQQANAEQNPHLSDKRPLFRDPSTQDMFDRNGYVVVDFLNPDEINTLSKSYLSLDGDLRNPAFASTIMSHDTEYRQSVSSAIERVFARAVSETFRDTQFFWGNFNVKFPSGNMGAVPLHQDPSFLDERYATALGIWVPLIDTTDENGALQVIPGSHTILTHPRCGGTPFPFANLQEILLKKFGRKLLMRAGQAYIGNPAVFHASPPNISSTARIVAAGLAGPDDSSLRYFDCKRSEGMAFAEMFEVDKHYYVSAPLFSRPDKDQYQILEVIPLDRPIPNASIIFETLSNFNGL